MFGNPNVAMTLKAARTRVIGVTGPDLDAETTDLLAAAAFWVMEQVAGAVGEGTAQVDFVKEAKAAVKKFRDSSDGQVQDRTRIEAVFKALDVSEFVNGLWHYRKFVLGGSWKTLLTLDGAELCDFIRGQKEAGENVPTTREYHTKFFRAMGRLAPDTKDEAAVRSVPAVVFGAERIKYVRTSPVKSKLYKDYCAKIGR
jgi:hypothetical protein